MDGDAFPTSGNFTVHEWTLGRLSEFHNCHIWSEMAMEKTAGLHRTKLKRTDCNWTSPKWGGEKTTVEGGGGGHMEEHCLVWEIKLG